ncbi:MAG TPA: YbjN domain-containing protein [Candidatus Scalindua sp.]|nr:YbjN domain-containing protein [Candidatus Scalindua sp.]|tara:strand:- start:84 stop:479 length:396 start_codon:yes stop_codon:yes gene_type:complete
MSENLQKVKDYLEELELSISSEDEAEEMVVIDDEDKGLKNLIIDCEDPILVLEQVIMDVPQNTEGFFKRLLQMNRTLVHGAFVLDEESTKVIFRDTLQLENLDKNELEGSITALSIALAEYAGELIEFSKS